MQSAGNKFDMEEVILVDTNDNEIGVMEKMQAHREGILHRAFSVFIFNSKKELLLQQRAYTKYHSGGLWTNTCCSHPRPDENTLDAAKRRLLEEMGMECKLKKLFTFIYKERLDNELTEHELDYVYIGYSDEKPLINKDEVADWKYLRISDLLNHIEAHPENYTMWLKLCINKVIKLLEDEN